MTRGPIREAILRALTLAPGLIPLGLLFGAAAANLGISPAATVALSATIFAGGAQFASIAILGAGGTLAAAVSIVAIVNSRYFLLSAATLDLARRSGATRTQRALLALGTVDESFALQAAWAKATIPSALGLLAVPATLWTLWCTSTLAGALVGEKLPDITPLGLDYALPGIFVGLFGIFADTPQRLQAGLLAFALAGALALAGLGLIAILTIPPITAFAYGWWHHAR